MSTVILGYLAVLLMLIGYMFTLYAFYKISHFIRYSLEHQLLFASIFIEFPLVLMENFLFMYTHHHNVLHNIHEIFAEKLFIVKILIITGAIGLIIFIIRTLMIFETKLVFFILNSAVAGSFITAAWFSLKIIRVSSNYYQIVYSSLGLGIVLIVTIFFLSVFSFAKYIDAFLLQRKFTHPIKKISNAILLESIGAGFYIATSLCLFIQRILFPQLFPVNSFTILFSLKNIVLSIGIFYLPLAYRISPNTNGVNLSLYNTKNYREFFRLSSKKIEQEKMSLRSTAIIGTALVATEITDDNVQFIEILGKKRKVIVSKNDKYIASLLYTGEDSIMVRYALRHLINFISKQSKGTNAEILSSVTDFIGFIFKLSEVPSERIMTDVVVYEFITV